MNQAETLCHSSGPWKKHKYISKVGEGAKAVYRYAKNADKTITGSAYKKEAKDEKERSEYANELAGHAPRALQVARNVDNVRNGAADYAFKTPDQWASSAAYHGRKAAEAESNYYNKSLFGRTEKAATKTANSAKKSAAKVKSLATDSVQRGKEKIKKLFSSETKVTHTSNVTGGKSSTSKKVKYNSDGTKVTVTNTFYPKKKK